MCSTIKIMDICSSNVGSKVPLKSVAARPTLTATKAFPEH